MQIDFKKIATILLRRWYILLIAAAVGGVIAVFVYMSSTPKFHVTASLMLRSQDDTARPTDDMMRMMGFSGANNVQDEVEVLASRRIFSEAIRDLGLQVEQRRKQRLRWVGEYGEYSCRLVLNPCLLDTLKHAARIDTYFDGKNYKLTLRYDLQRFGWKYKASYVAREGETVETLLGPIVIRGNETEPYRLRTRILPLNEAVAGMQNEVDVSSVTLESNIVDLSVVTDMPRLMEDFLTRVISLYNEFAVEDKNVLAGQSAQFIAERLEIVQSQLDSVETAVEDYRKTHLITDLSQEGNMYMHASQSYENRLSDLRTQLRLVEYIRSLLSDEADETALIPANLGVQDGSLQNLIVDYNHLVVEHIRLA